MSYCHTSWQYDWYTEIELYVYVGIVQRRTFVRNKSTVLTRVIVGLFIIDEKPTIFVDKRTKYIHLSRVNKDLDSWLTWLC